MKNQKKIIFEVFLVSLSIIFSLVIWRYIFLPYTSTDIVGNYSINNYNQNNDLLRYLFFITFSLIVFILTKYFGEKNIFKIFLENLRNIKISHSKDNFLILLFVGLIFLVFLEFFSIEFKPQLDVYHDGQLITSAFKNYQDNSLWSGSYIITGIFNETLLSKFAWNFFDTLSIGSAKFGFIFLVLINKILLTFFAFQITSNVNLRFYSKCIFLLLIFLIFQNLIDYNFGKGDHFNYRDLPILLLLILLPYAISEKKYSHIFVFCIGFISLFTFFWSLDRGIIFNLLIILIFIYFALINHYFKVLLLLTSIIMSWLLSSHLLEDEFNHFILNSISILKEINNIHGIIHPLPLSEEQNSARATKGLLAIIISMIIVLNLFLKKNDKYSYNTKFILFFISACCFLGYLNAIGRSDGIHIKNSFTFPIIFFSILILFNFLFFLEKKFYLLFNNFNNRLSIILLILITSYFGLEIKSQNIYSFPNRLGSYINLEDRKFIPAQYEQFIDKMKPILRNEDCIQLFTNNAILPYLLRKKNCTKYYYVWAVGSEKVQNDFINEMNKVKFIIADKVEIENEFSPAYRLHHLTKHINKHYKEILSSYKFRVLMKKN